MINGVPVVTAPAEIDATTAEQLRTVLLRTADRGHATIVVDMTRTRFCDSAGLAVLAGAHRRALGQGGGLRLVRPAGGAVARVLSFTGLNCFIPGFGTLDEALTAPPAAVIRPSRPRPPAGLLDLLSTRASFGWLCRCVLLGGEMGTPLAAVCRWPGPGAR